MNGMLRTLGYTAKGSAFSQNVWALMPSGKAPAALASRAAWPELSISLAYTTTRRISGLTPVGLWSYSPTHPEG